MDQACDQIQSSLDLLMWLDMQRWDVERNTIYLCGKNKIVKYIQSGSGSKICRITFHSYFTLFRHSNLNLATAVRHHGTRGTGKADDAGLGDDVVVTDTRGCPQAPHRDLHLRPWWLEPGQPQGERRLLSVQAQVQVSQDEESGERIKVWQFGLKANYF